MKKIIVLICSVLLLTTVQHSSLAQSELRCGEQFNGSFVDAPQRTDYVLAMSSGQRFTVAGDPVGDSLEFSIMVIDPANSRDIAKNQVSGQVQPEPFADTGVLSATGTYTIRVANTRLAFNQEWNSSNSWGGVGDYTLVIRCFDEQGVEFGRNGEFFGPERDITIAIPSDISSVTRISLSVGATSAIEIPTDGNALTVFQFDGDTSQPIVLSITRNSGNQNIGVHILNSQDEIVFQSSLIISDDLTTALVFPTNDTYRLVLYRSDVLPPSTPTATEIGIALSSP